jgi:ABC-2 type transport system permease protein
MRLFAHQLRSEQLLFWRSREAAFFVFVFPLLLFVLLASVYTGKISGRPAPWALLIGLIGYGCANTAFVGLALLLVGRREQGVLKRLRATPLPPATYLAAALASMVIVFSLQVVALFALGKAMKSTPVPGHLLSLVLTFLLGVLAFAGMGFAAASLIRSAEGSSAALNVVLLPMAFLSGSFGPTRHYPRVLRAIGDVLPLKYLINTLDAIYLHGHELWSRPGSIGVLAAWGAGGLAVAARAFRWEPTEG